MADQNCPTCGAPCTTDIEPRGGDYGWSTSDKERTVYTYAPKTALDSFIDDVEAAEPERAAFEADAEPMGFDLTRVSLAVPEPWSEYADETTGHRWGGWLARADTDMNAVGWIAISERMPALGQSVALIDADGWENTGGDLEMNIRACGYFSQMGSVRFWSIRSERATSIDAFTHWLALPELPCAAMKGDQP